jgi:hypothetical protein
LWARPPVPQLALCIFASTRLHRGHYAYPLSRRGLVYGPTNDVGLGCPLAGISRLFWSRAWFTRTNSGLAVVAGSSASGLWSTTGRFHLHDLLILGLHALYLSVGLLFGLAHGWQSRMPIGLILVGGMVSTHRLHVLRVATQHSWFFSADAAKAVGGIVCLWSLPWLRR